MNDKRKIVTDILGSYRRAGDEHLFTCPYCDHHKKKMSVNFSINSFKCWVCDARGKNIYRLVRKFGNYKQRQKYLELQGRLDLTEFDDIFNELNDVEEKQVVELPTEFVSLCNQRLPLRSQAPLEYLRGRGITKKEILKWKMGYCHEGKYGGRVVIPSFNNDGNCNYFIARSYVGHGRRYLNPPCGRAIHDTPVFIALDPDAEKKAQWMIKSLMKYDLEIKKLNIGSYEDIGSMSPEVFQEKLKTAEDVDGDMYWIEKQLRNL